MQDWAVVHAASAAVIMGGDGNQEVEQRAVERILPRRQMDALEARTGPDPSVGQRGLQAKVPLSVEQKLAAYLIRMSSGDSWRMIFESIGIGVSTAQWHCWMVAKAGVQVYGHLVCIVRYERSLPAIQAQLKVGGHGWFGVVGAIDCSHVVVGNSAGAHGKR